MSDATRSEQEPHDRLTRICEAMTETMEGHPEAQPGDKAMIFLDNDEERRGGLVLAGYDDDADAIGNLLAHVKAIFEANGMSFQIVPLDRPPGQG